jgi:hypothetical protein
MRRSAFLKTLIVAALAALAGFASVAPSLADSDSDARRNEFYRRLHERQQQRARSDGAETVLLVSGVIGPGAHNQFQAALARGTARMVVLDGPGGVLGEAILIGEEVRRRQMSTLVAPHHRCASACAVVFLSGRTKYLGAGAEVGLHSASYLDGRADPEATELMAAYLRQMGVPAATLQRMARTAPSDIRWLTTAEQQAIGIKAYKSQ